MRHFRKNFQMPKIPDIRFGVRGICVHKLILIHGFVGRVDDVELAGVCVSCRGHCGAV